MAPVEVMSHICDGVPEKNSSIVIVWPDVTITAFNGHLLKLITVADAGILNVPFELLIFPDKYFNVFVEYATVPLIVLLPFNVKLLLIVPVPLQVPPVKIISAVPLSVAPRVNPPPIVAVSAVVRLRVVAADMVINPVADRLEVRVVVLVEVNDMLAQVIPLVSNVHVPDIANVLPVVVTTPDVYFNLPVL